MRFVSVVPPKGFDTPCYVCVSHTYNEDGYLYKSWKVEAEGRKIKEPFYRFILQAHLGWSEWPKGLEVNHKCQNRACCNPAHLQALERSDHKRVTNTLRYEPRNEAARLHWMIHGCTGTELAKLFGVSFSAACRWIREWKAEDQME
ncbi:HNH endonuclease [Novosphingobium sp.]|uniref:HNH endonuclease n=1 Tax=Novosphingobium sp. TaxID=1874826 RepID=UPI00261CA527|nr:HNH endonuclease [Novosphingobium sp.]